MWNETFSYIVVLLKGDRSISASIENLQMHGLINFPKFWKGEDINDEASA